jgi:hypothetical protein
MAISMDFRTMVKGSLRAAVSGVLCVLMVGSRLWRRQRCSALRSFSADSGKVGITLAVLG